MTQSPLEARFWCKVNRNGPTPPHRPELGPCWDWTAGKFKAGYGGFRITTPPKYTIKSHRMAWILTYGEIPPGMGILHKCDRPICVNPVHLFLGDQKVNSQDCKHKLRNHRGQDTPSSKLSNDDVIKIVSMIQSDIELSDQKIADIFMVSRKAIAFIRTGQNWNWLTNIKPESEPAATAGPPPVET